MDNFAAKNEYLNNTYNFVMKYVDKYFEKPVEEQSNEQENINETQDTNSEEQNNENTDENIGGAIEEENQNIETAEENTNENTEKTQEELDVEYIKNNISFIVPIEGRISSTFGWRNPTTPTVPKYHTGLDIAANRGTVIKSATNGTIILASSEGDFGKHYTVQVGEIQIIYAHCDKLYLDEGTEIYQGQEIAEVGSTGNTTGPHLHFEIRRDGRKIDPQLILDI